MILLAMGSLRKVAVRVCSNTSKIKVVSAPTPGERHQAVLFGSELLENVDKFKYFGSMFITNVKRTEMIRSRIYLARILF